MPVAGRKPKDPAQRRNRMPPRHDWTEVLNVPYGKGPRLPAWPPNFEPFYNRPPPHCWPEATQRWWKAVKAMPHCVTWEPSDWQFAMDTALIVAAFHCGELRFAAEVRTRERTLGLTADFRRDLRIRYIDPNIGTESDPNETASVTAMADYQRMVDDEG